MAQKTESFSIGVMASDHVAVGVVQDHKVRGSVHAIPDLATIPPDSLAPVIREIIDAICLEAGVDPAAFEALDFERFALQPMDGPDREAATRTAIAYCLDHPRWRLSLQTHKYLGIP